VAARANLPGGRSLTHKQEFRPYPYPPGVLAMKSFILVGWSCACVVAATMLVAPTKGAAPAFQQKEPPEVGEQARDFALKELNGKPLKLTGFDNLQPIVLVFLRGYPGYQCPMCMAQFADFLAIADKIKKVNGVVLFVYPGPANNLEAKAKEFVKGKSYPDHFKILLDPDYTAVNLYGVRWNAPNETAYPATFVINRRGRIANANISKTHGDRMKANELLDALDTLNSGQ
jgi:thioredoxin-dependent peroxiredoxin